MQFHSPEFYKQWLLFFNKFLKVVSGLLQKCIVFDPREVAPCSGARLSCIKKHRLWACLYFFCIRTCFIFAFTQLVILLMDLKFHRNYHTSRIQFRRVTRQLMRLFMHCNAPDWPLTALVLGFFIFSALLQYIRTFFCHTMLTVRLLHWTSSPVRQTLKNCHDSCQVIDGYFVFAAISTCFVNHFDVKNYARFS
jgi:hypothetical protein